MELWQFLGNPHPKLVQFPLVLLLVGLLIDLDGLLRNSAKAHWAALSLSTFGTLGLLMAFICGIYAEFWAGRAGIPHHPIEIHELIANIASWGFVILFAWRLFLVASAAAGQTATLTMKRRPLKAYVTLGFIWYGLLALAAWYGGQLVFDYGAASSTGGSQGILTLSDLNTLATRQTDENLAYSEWMHHIFGWITLALSVSLLAQWFWPKAQYATALIIPLAFLAGGIFLFFMADLDLYSLTDPRQWRDREVQLHKALALIMALIGGGGLWRLKAKFTRSKTTQPEASTTAANATTGDRASRLVAVLALIGGAMLFTHVHTVAPYANVAAGVYIAHLVMGVVALAIGATRLLQQHTPRESARRSLALAFAGLMTIEAGLLITYNEGLPWFIGYGKYDRWGPGKDPGISVAPFGSFRALLAVNQETGDLYVAFRDRFDNEKKVELSLDDFPKLLIMRNGVETALTLRQRPNASGGEGAWQNASTTAPDTELVGSYFSAHAEFAKTTPFISARLLLQINGREQVGLFDPWVTPLIRPVPENQTAHFECPMHEGIRAVELAHCPLCDMLMQPIKAQRGAELADPGFALDLRPLQIQKSPTSVAVEMLMTPTRDGKPVGDLAIVHEQPIHLFVVTQELDYFDHMHPARETVAGPIAIAEADAKGGGMFRWIYHFPRPGNYLLFAEFTPRGDRAQTIRTPITIKPDGSIDFSPAGLSPATGRTLTPDAAFSKFAATRPAPATPRNSAPWSEFAPPPAAADRSIHVQLLSQPRTIFAGLHADLIMTLSDDTGRPLTTLEPYLGALGHCVAISESTGQFIHAHPQTWMTEQQLRDAGPTGGPAGPFHALFPTPGRWRVWAQFKRQGELITAEFTINVRQSTLPASLWKFLLGN